MVDENLKEVNFQKYCKLCNNEYLEETKDPCNKCLSEPANYGTDKPVVFEDKKNL